MTADTSLRDRASIVPLGTRAVLVRFAATLSDSANRRAIGFAAALEADPPEGVEEVAPGLVSVLLRIRAGVDFWRLSGELRLRLGAAPAPLPAGVTTIPIVYDGADLPAVAGLLRRTPAEFVARHTAARLRVLAIGFAPGFVYCGLHPDDLVVPRRATVRPLVPAGTVLFAAGQTAIPATPIRTGWHVIGRTVFQNFVPDADPPLRLGPGDGVRFAAAA